MRLRREVLPPRERLDVADMHRIEAQRHADADHRRIVVTAAAMVVLSGIAAHLLEVFPC